MDDFMKDSILRSNSEIGRIITRADEGLASLFKRIIDGITEVDDINKREGSPYDNKGKAIEDFFRNTRNINTIPFGKPTTNCYEECVAIALKSFKTSYSFSKAITQIKNYSINCGETNCRILIVTDHWDRYIFDRDHKEFFDSYTSKRNKNNVKHTVAIVLYGNHGVSIQYLK